MSIDGPLSAARLPASGTAPARLLVPAYVATMLLSAALLFLVQPMIARMALPLLGGTPAVWAIAMCFFQAVLLGGYAYAHLLNRYLSPAAAAGLHVALMGMGWFTLPPHILGGDVPLGGATAGVALAGVFATAIGYPFFFVSATAPLLQSWFARTSHRDAGSPYFLYSASNIGSLGALVAYPFVIEPAVGLKAQALLWSAGYMVLAAAIAICGTLMLRLQSPLHLTETAAAPPLIWRQRAWWMLMAFVPSALLVAWTNHITTDIASAPFLWLPPLVLFLLTFVLVFRDRPLISLQIARAVQLAALPVAFVVQFALPLWLTVPVMVIGALSFFATALICHRQLYDSRPAATQLTEFYMLMSLGGVLGGLFVSLIAPLVFNSVLEYPLLLIIGAAVSRDLIDDARLLALLRRPLLPLAAFAGLLPLIAFAAPDGGPHLLLASRTVEIAFFGAIAVLLFRAGRHGLAALALLLCFLVNLTGPPNERVALRSYFGVLSVADGAEGPFRLLTHGTTMHGAQRLSELAPDYQGRPHALTYYSPEGGMARALIATQQRLAGEGRSGTYRIIGLGTGSLACYARAGEDWAYYEIDRDVIRVARDASQFTFLSRCAPGLRIVEGDARITLQQERGAKADYLLVDAFSSDSIPVHLITREAMQLYLDRIAGDGVLVMHVTNRFMDLVPVVAANMRAIDPALEGRVIDYVPEQKDVAAMHSIAIVMSRNPQALARLDADGGTAPLQPVAGIGPWTDDIADLPGAILRRIGQTRY